VRRHGGGLDPSDPYDADPLSAYQDEGYYTEAEAGPMDVIEARAREIAQWACQSPYSTAPADQHLGNGNGVLEPALAQRLYEEMSELNSTSFQEGMESAILRICPICAEGYDLAPTVVETEPVVAGHYTRLATLPTLTLTTTLTTTHHHVYRRAYEGVIAIPDIADASHTILTVPCPASPIHAVLDEFVQAGRPERVPASRPPHPPGARRPDSRVHGLAHLSRIRHLL
jgi:hypothetical protein